LERNPASSAGGPAAGRVTGSGAPSAPPQPPQNRAAAGLSVPHDAQSTCKRAAHDPQNLASAGLFVPHSVHFMLVQNR
jgi:hypothetical protein